MDHTLHPATASLPYAVAVVLSAAPILALVLVMVTTRPTRVSVMFLVGWLGGILTVAGILVAFVDAAARPRLPETANGIVRLVLGGILAMLAVRSWQKRDEAGDAPPKWLSNIKRWSPSRALGVGYALGTLNPKNLALVASGAAAILGTSAAARQQAVAVLVFSVVASMGIAVPIAMRELGGPVMNRVLDRAARWMTANGKTISSVVLAIIAVVLVVTGVSRL